MQDDLLGDEDSSKLIEQSHEYDFSLNADIVVLYIAVLIAKFLLYVSQEIVELLGILGLRDQPKFIVLIIDYPHLKAAKLRVVMDVFEDVVCIEVGSVDVSALIDPHYLCNIGELLQRSTLCYGFVGKLVVMLVAGEIEAVVQLHHFCAG